MSFIKTIFIVSLLSAICIGCNTNASKENKEVISDAPRIINIVNFIRQTDYRVENADSLLFETVQDKIIK